MNDDRSRRSEKVNNAMQVVKAWSLLLEAAPDLEEQSTFHYDLVDVGRQVVRYPFAISSLHVVLRAN